MQEPEGIALIDVDGVINSWAPWHRAKGMLGVPDVKTEDVETLYSVHLVMGIRERLSELDEAFECIWTTAWTDDAPEILGPILEVGRDWPVIPFRDVKVQQRRAPAHTTWKLPTVSEWIAHWRPNRPVVWIDDDLNFDAYAWERHRIAPTLLLETDMYEGFTERDLIDVLEWGEGLRRAA